jgi:hypothetical protein
VTTCFYFANDTKKEYQNTLVNLNNNRELCPRVQIEFLLNIPIDSVDLHSTTERSPNYDTNKARSLICGLLIVTTGKEITIEKSYADVRRLITFFCWVSYCDYKESVYIFAYDTKEKKRQNTPLIQNQICSFYYLYTDT